MATDVCKDLSTQMFMIVNTIIARGREKERKEERKEEKRQKEEKKEGRKALPVKKKKLNKL